MRRKARNEESIDMMRRRWTQKHRPHVILSKIA